MTLRLENQILDDFPDEVGNCLRKLRAIPTWTANKFDLYAEFERLAKRERHKRFKADFRDYHIECKGQHVLYDVPRAQRGALRSLAGKRIRLVCGEYLGPYAARIYFAKKVSGVVL